MSEKVIYDSVQIQSILPHRYPFLMVDKIVELVDNQKVVAIKNVSINEPFFQGHFPGRPVMPGVMMLEAMAQAGAILAKQSADGVREGKLVYLVGADDFKWRKQVVPGDTLVITMESVRKRRPIWIMKGTVTVDGEVVASGSLSACESD